MIANSKNCKTAERNLIPLIIQSIATMSLFAGTAAVEHGISVIKRADSKSVLFHSLAHFPVATGKGRPPSQSASSLRNS